MSMADTSNDVDALRVLLCCFFEPTNTVIKCFLNLFYLFCDIASPVRTGLAAPSLVTFIAFVNTFASLGLNWPFFVPFSLLPWDYEFFLSCL